MPERLEEAQRLSDQSLVPLADLPSLQWIRLFNQFPTEEFARLSVALPEIEYTHFAPYLEHRVDDDGPRQVMVIGKGKPFLALPQDTARLNRSVAQFMAMQKRFREQGGNVA